MILEEYDYNKNAVINPSDFMKGKVPKDLKIPKIAVTCFEYKTFDRLLLLLKAEEIFKCESANGEQPIYRALYKGVEIALFMADVGAAGVAGQLEEVYEIGIETVIVFGSCGVLDKNIADCSIIIPDAAVRDEGLSYHYLPPSDEMEVNRKYMDTFIELLDEVKCPYTIGKTWTTDAIYRETKAKAEARKASGCICVDMECSAMAAVAEFREKELFHFFYSSDCLDGGEWDIRSLGCNVKFEEKDYYAHLALELAVRIDGNNSFGQQ